jgi:Zn-dependent alcohol dehydrogenase
MKSAILIENKKPLIVADVELPAKLKFGQVLVKICYSGICGAQIDEIDAVKEADKYLPHLLGHEGSGIVEKIGEGVTTVKPNDHVVLHWRKSTGIESSSAKYSWNGKQVNAGRITTFSEKAIISENRLTAIPSNFDMRLASLFGCSVLTAFGVVNNDAKIKIGQSVLIFGIGGVGLNIVQAASMVSAYPIVGVDLHENKINMGKKFGLTHGLIADSNDLNNKIYNIIGSKGADISIETTGIPKVIEQAYELTAPDGKTILVGVPNDKISIYSLPLHFEKVLTGSHGGDAIPNIDIPRYIRLISQKKMTLENIITHEFNLKEINSAIDLLRSGKAGRIIIKMN